MKKGEGMPDKYLEGINKSLKGFGIQIVGYTKEQPKTELEAIIEIIEIVFCFNEKQGNEAVIKTGKRIIAFLREQDKLIKKGRS